MSDKEINDKPIALMSWHELKIKCTDQQHLIEQQGKEMIRRKELIDKQRMYIGFLQSAVRSGEKWEGNIGDFIQRLSGGTP